MFYKTKEEIDRLVKKFQERTLPKTDWTHAAHLTVGLYYCFHNSPDAAKKLMTDGIYRLNEAHGTANTKTSGYHETLTLFWLKTISSFLERNRDEKNLTVLTNEMLKFYNDSHFPFNFYSRERLFSVEARLHYAEPDLGLFAVSLGDPILAG